MADRRAWAGQTPRGDPSRPTQGQSGTSRGHSSRPTQGKGGYDNLGDTPADTGATPIAAPPVPQQGPNRTATSVVPTDPLPVYYGTNYRVGAQIWYEKVQADGSIVVLYLICHGQINSIANITIEDKPLSTFNMVVTTNYNIHTGTAAQTADALLTTAEPSFTGAFPYVAYVVMKFPAPSASQPAPDWRRFLCDVQGMLVRDPRTDSTLVTRYYRDNPALCIADFMTSPIRVAADGQSYPYGAGMPDSKLDWAGTITAAANDCDVLLVDGTTKRFTMGYGIISKQDWMVSVTAMRAHAQLLAPQYNNGVYQIMMDKSQSAAAVTLTDSGPTANIVAVSPMTVKGSAQIPTHVPCDFINPAASYKDDQAFDDDPSIAAGGEIIQPPSNYKFGTMPYDQAKRLCKYLRKRLAKDKSGTLFLLNDTGVQLLPGIRVPLTSAYYGFTAQDIIIASLHRVADPRWAFEAGWELYDANVYDDTQWTGGATAPVLPTSPYDLVLTGPEITTPVASAAAATLYWSPNYLRSATLYGTAFWTAVNLTNYVAANVNDGDINTKAFGWDNATTASITWDFGSAIYVPEFWKYYSVIGSQVGVLQTSSDNVSYTDVPGQYEACSVSVGGGITLRIHVAPPAVGAKRYWRLVKKVGVAETTAFTEVWPRTYTATQFTLIKEARIYTTSSFNKAALWKRVITSPTSANPIDLTSFPGGLTANVTSMVVTTVGSSGLETNGCGFVVTA